MMEQEALKRELQALLLRLAPAANTPPANTTRERASKRVAAASRHGHSKGQSKKLYSYRLY
jgi:hypothetical protein